MFIPMIASFKPRESNTKFQDFANLLLNQFSELMQELHKQHDFKIMHSVVQPLWTSLGTLLSGLYTSKQFDHTFRTNLNSLREIVGNMSPDKHSRPSSVLLKVLQKGLTAMSQQLGYGYVSAYSERTWIDKEQRKYAKIIFTIFRILHVSLTMLKVNCKSLSGQQLNQSTDLGKIIADEGFNVSDQDGQNGELRNKQDCKGSDIINLLIRNVDGANNNEHLKTLKPNERNKFSLMSIIACLMSHLDEYNKVCHHSTISVKRSPCSVYEQLVWLIGLPHNQVFDKFSVYCRELFDKPKKDDKRDYSEIPSSELQLGAYPYTINYDDLVPAIKRVCQHSHRVLTTILGHGHSAGIYASDFSNNSLNFYYPSSMSTLVCMLLDVLKRIYYQLSFICRQCKYTSKLSGWRDCSYGRGVGGSNWQCNTLTYANQTCDQHCKQLANQSANLCAKQIGNQNTKQKCDQHPNCGLKSPLQSFLEDGLQGFLPHKVSVKGTKMSCSSCSQTPPGQPCKTPMGFPEIATTASHTKTGMDIYMVLTDFCGTELSPLTRLCSVFSCLLPSAPKSLGDMFAFYFNFNNRWYLHGSGVREMHREIAFETSVKKAYFGSPYPELNECSELFTPDKHSSSHAAGYLTCLSTTEVTCYIGNKNVGRIWSP
ncbi:hypothetical protein, conserved [Babesia ovata]|uniref:Uncharacterized protein n=1 Tax=Babesia ovata TaxID=189622 RepID=A0A2H6KK55_9APIC|nr:uncharacterized protein BOVATA_048520 [Babesia ovata]GBE63359.1 hypothetical protein, conserved [Babesia ovata]